jgi:hypothetical protein
VVSAARTVRCTRTSIAKSAAAATAAAAAGLRRAAEPSTKGSSPAASRAAGIHANVDAQRTSARVRGQASAAGARGCVARCRQREHARTQDEG